MAVELTDIVKRSGSDGYKVFLPGGPFTVARTEILGWCVFKGRNLDLVQAGFKTPEEAVKTLFEAYGKATR
jgi:hypothetical protein